MTRRLWLAVIAFAGCGLATAADGMFTFEVYADQKGEHRWRLKDGDTVVATSGQGYKAKADCRTMVDNLVADISKYTFEVYEDKKKESRWRLKAKNGQTVGGSASAYKSKADAEAAVEAVKKGAKDAKVVEAKEK